MACSFSAHVSSAMPSVEIGAQQFGQIRRVIGGMGDGQRGIFGIDLDRRGVERKLGRRLGQQEAHDALHLDPERRGEGQRDPRRVLALLQVVASRRRVPGARGPRRFLVSVNGIFIGAPRLFHASSRGPSIAP